MQLSGEKLCLECVPAHLNLFTMSLTLRTELGYTEALITDDGTLREFYHTADILNRDMQIKFVRKEDDFDSLNWAFKFKGHELTLQYSIYTGITVFPSKNGAAARKDNKAVEDFANVLRATLEARTGRA
ncbi:DUF3630 family protein [Nostoc ellipsosporum NOK]|nr:DUF3630 family protein [Nostoc ellipsosporum NOK]